MMNKPLLVHSWQKTNFSLEEGFVCTELGSQLKTSSSDSVFCLKSFYDFDF